MTIDVFLSRLEGVRRTGPGRWLAKCPAHSDRSPSLSVRELDDGRTLVHCFAQCSVENVLNAVGLGFDVLFPEKTIDHHVKREQRPFNAHDVLRALRDEIDIAAIFCADVFYCNGFFEEDYRRFGDACARIREAERLANGER